VKEQFSSIDMMSGSWLDIYQSRANPALEYSYHQIQWWLLVKGI